MMTIAELNEFLRNFFIKWVAEAATCDYKFWKEEDCSSEFVKNSLSSNEDLIRRLISYLETLEELKGTDLTETFSTLEPFSMNL